MVESSADFFSDAEIDRWVNQGYKAFVARTDWTEKVKAYTMVANQFEYTLPSDIKRIDLVMWEDQYKVEWADLEEFREYVGTSDGTSSDRPVVYRTYPWDGKMRVYPIPSAASASSTVSGAHNDTVGTIAVASGTSFPTRGRAIINSSEQILYYNKSGNNLLQCTRGDGYTTAASYAGGETIVHAPLEVYMVYQPPDIATGVDSRIGPSYDEALICYACHVARLKKGKFDEAKAYRQLFDTLVDKAVEERAKQQRDRLHVIKLDGE